MAEPIEARKLLLENTVKYVKTCTEKGETPRLVFICTHNSRRSQFSQVLAKAVADYYGIRIQSFSGGTEVTEVNETVIETLENIGYDTESDGSLKNPIYKVSNGRESLALFSKVYDDRKNPKDSFAAVMTCSSADEACPFIPNAAIRVPLTYEDPKRSDGTTEASQVYRACADLIASEMKFIMQNVKS